MFEKTARIAACLLKVLPLLYVLTHACFGNNSELPYSVEMEDVHTIHSLISHVIEVKTVRSSLDCRLHCLLNCLCVSFNLYVADMKCELNSARKTDYPADYVANVASTYYEFSWNNDYTGSKVTRCSGCCGTSNPCLNGGKCHPVNYIHGQRFRCFCPDGYNGKRCELKPRSCADYAQSPNRKPGLRLIYMPDNKMLSVFCHFREGTTMTLAMSFTRTTLKDKRGIGLEENHRINGDNPNLSHYRLSMGEMKALRDVSTRWAFTCAYDTRGFSTTDYILSKISENDLNTFRGQSCMLYEYVNIKDNVCENCTLLTTQTVAEFFHLKSKAITANTCDGFTLSQGVINCPMGGPSYYFGWYSCTQDTAFTCTTLESSTTQFWFVS